MCACRWRRILIASCLWLGLLPLTLLASYGQGTPAAVPVGSEPTDTCAAITEDYPPLSEIRDIQARPWSLAGIKFSIEGIVQYIYVSPEGQGIELGDEEAYRDVFRTRLGIEIDFPDGDTEVIDVGYHEDPVGVYDGDVVVIGGELVGTVTGETEAGNEHVWPFMIADYIRGVGATLDGALPPTCAVASPGATPQAASGATPALEQGVNAETPTTTRSTGSEPLVVAGTGSVVTEDFELEAGRYQVTLDVASGCCITLYIYGSSGSEEMLFSEIFSSDGGTVEQIYQVEKSGLYFINTQNTESDWTLTFTKR